MSKDIEKKLNEEALEEAYESETTQESTEEATEESTEEATAEETTEETTEDATENDSEAENSEDAKEETDSKKEKKKIFGNKKDKKDEQIEELTDRNQRLMAEFQNFRNRSEKEKSAMFEIGAKTIIEKMLPVVDNFERGLATMSDEDLNSPVGQGMTMIYKQLTTTLEELGVEVIKTEGAEFDPELHNAVMHIDDEAFGENTVAEEFQKGYTYRGTVIRHSMVKVAN